MAHQINISVPICVSVVPANDQDLPELVRGDGHVAVFFGCPPICIPIGSRSAVDVFAAYARGATVKEAADNLEEALETTIRRTVEKDSYSGDATLTVGDGRHPALVRLDLLPFS